MQQWRFTATVCENAALFTAAPERGEIDTRDVWDRDDATGALAEAFRVLAEGVAPDGVQLADEREPLLWGFVNMLHAQTVLSAAVLRSGGDVAAGDADRADAER